MATVENHHPLPAPPPHQERYSLPPTPLEQQLQYQQHQQQQQQQHYPPVSYQPQAQQQQHVRYSTQPQRQSQQQQQKPQQKPRSFSFRSDRSHGSNKADLHETSAEKEAKRLHTKADPTMAMNEAEPAHVQASVKSSLAPLRSIQHRDGLGNPISDPDRSNPTRSRWERPLDTIRSFEAAIDGGYSSRKSFIRADSDSMANWNRRSSYYGNNGPRFPHDSYYGRPQSSFRPESAHFDTRSQRDSYFDQQQVAHAANGANGSNGANSANGYGQGAGPSRLRASRMQSQPDFSTYGRGEQAVYPLPHKDRSYETVTSAAGSGSSAEPAGYQTDLTSSDNSSIDRRSPAKAPQPANDYGINFGQSGTYQPPAFTVGSNPNLPNPQSTQNRQSLQKQPAQAYQNKAVAPQHFGAPPPVPRKDLGGVQRRPVPQQHQSQQYYPQQLQQQQMQRPELGEKRKSWFSRRFSKAN